MQKLCGRALIRPACFSVSSLLGRCTREEGVCCDQSWSDNPCLILAIDFEMSFQQGNHLIDAIGLLQQVAEGEDHDFFWYSVND